jgi:hypothetical protein
MDILSPVIYLLDIFKIKFAVYYLLIIYNKYMYIMKLNYINIILFLINHILFRNKY